MKTTNSYMCASSSAGNCRITLSRAYTPILYYLSPPVMYFGSETAFWVDPRSSQNIVASGSEWPFIEARVNGYTVDFNSFVDVSTTFNSYSRNQVRGNIGNILPNASASVNFKFKTGNAMHFDSSMIRCDYQNASCYSAKILPVINSIDAQDGYTTGGQTVTVKGFGFKSSNIQASIDGAPCQVQSYQ